MSESQILVEDYRIRDQVAAVLVASINAAREGAGAAALKLQDLALLGAVAEIDKVRAFVGDPRHILGRFNTKHGEIAEQVEVGVRRARDILSQVKPDASFDGVGRFCPEDYVVNNAEVQSKFINGTVGSLKHVLDHMDKYKHFGRDGSYYHIPKDQFAQIRDALAGKTDGLSARTLRAIYEKVSKIEAETGHSFNRVVRPGVSDYAEVQPGKVPETLNRHEGDLRTENRSLEDNIRSDHQGTLAEGTQAAALGAGIGAGICFIAGVVKKKKEGKNLFMGDFMAEDWKELGVSSLKGGVGGAVASGGIYVLTNSAGLAAPLAGAVVSAFKGMVPLVRDYHAGKITLDQLIDNGMLVSSEAAIVGLCSIAGQTLIPIPGVGAILGSIAGKVMAQAVGKQVRGLQEAIERRTGLIIAALDTKYREIVEQLDREFSRLGELTTVAFDLARNQTLLQDSVSLARAYGVSEQKLMLNSEAVDAFILS